MNREPRRGPTNRGRWIDELLKGLPPNVSSAAHRRLAAALMPLFGSDAIVWTTDLAELPRDEAIEVLAWMAKALIAATLADSEGTTQAGKVQPRRPPRRLTGMTPSGPAHWAPDPTQSTRAQRLRTVGAVVAVVATVGAAAVAVTLPQRWSNSRPSNANAASNAGSASSGVSSQAVRLRDTPRSCSACPAAAR